jgi:hypothetical protein
MQLAETSPRDSAVASVHRSMNERRSQSPAPSVVANSITCECECHRTECDQHFEVAVASYEAVRAEGRRFIVAPNHQTRDELMISERNAYSVIEKVGDKGVLAQALDPR